MKLTRAMRKAPFKMKDGWKVIDDKTLGLYLSDRSPFVNRIRLRSLLRDDKILYEDKRDILDYANDKACRFTSGDEIFIVRLVWKYWNKFGGDRRQ